VYWRQLPEPTLKGRLQFRKQSLVFLGGLALLLFGDSRPASPRLRIALQPTENVPIASLPFEFIRKHILVAIQINDAGPHACMVDNGFNTEVVTERAARAMGLQSHAAGGKTPNAKGFGEGAGPEMFVTENSIVLGEKGFPLLTGHTLVLDMAALEKELGHPFDCVIGAPLFARFVVEVDFANRRLTLYDPSSFAYRGQGHVVPLRVAVPPTIEAEVLTPDGRRVKATVGLDLGSDSVFDFPPSFQSKHHILQPQQSEVVTGAIGLKGEFHTRVVRLPFVEFAGFRVEKPIAEFLEGSLDSHLSKNDGFVGNALLERFNVIFDYSRHQVILEPNPSFGDPFVGNTTGIGADPTSDPVRGFDVKSLEDGSVAAAAGLNPGDRIVEINGVLCSTLTFESFHEMLTAEGAPFKLKVERGSEKIEISFQTPRLP
jgi:hypothetical protein